MRNEVHPRCPGCHVILAESRIVVLGAQSGARQCPMRSFAPSRTPKTKKKRSCRVLLSRHVHSLCIYCNLKKPHCQLSMKSLGCLFVFLSITTLSTAAFLQSRNPSRGLFRKPQPTAKKSSNFDRFVNKLFDDADTNQDGSVSFSEAYEMILKLYVRLNRRAPIPPPTRKKVLILYLDADLSKNNRLDREEFRGLAKTAARRALSRLVAHKVVKWFCAPLLAEYLVRTLASKQWPENLAKAIIPNGLHEKVLPVVTSKSFCRTVLIVAFVVSLGNLVLGIVNWILDMSLPDEKDDPRLERYLKRQ